MKIETKSKLLKLYGELNSPKKTTAIKYRYKYKEVNINIFFDAFDSENTNLSIVLAYEDSYYYTSLNINKSTTSKEYLPEIPPNILNQILDENNMLNAFFKSIEKHISSRDANVINYDEEKIFFNTIKFCKNRKELPFLLSTRKATMSNKMFNILSETMSIDNKILKKLQEHNMTLVRTADPHKRKNLTIILDKNGISKIKN